jgi:DNA-directed RNA polymerase specialized sigma24 family protein
MQYSTGTSAFVTENSHAADLYRLYAAKLLSYLRRHLPRAEDAEDLLLDVFYCCA